VRLPALAEILGRRETRPKNPIAVAAGLIFAAVIIAAIHAALGMVFDPRYRDFPDAALTAAIVPVVLLIWFGPHATGRRPLAETVAAVALTVSAVYIGFNETVANWQAMWLAAVLILLAFTLTRVRDAQSSAQ
jgi:hypothetical protein